MRMHLEVDLGREAGALDQLGQARDGERCAPYTVSSSAGN